MRLLSGKVFLSGQLRRGACFVAKKERMIEDVAMAVAYHLQAFVMYGSNYPEGIRINSSWGSVSHSAPVSVMTTISSTEIVLVVESDSGHE